MAVASAATDPANCIAFQGASGAYGDLACRTAYPDMATLPCDTFEETFNAARMPLSHYNFVLSHCIWTCQRTKSH